MALRQMGERLKFWVPLYESRKQKPIKGHREKRLRQIEFIDVSRRLVGQRTWSASISQGKCNREFPMINSIMNVVPGIV